jgi:hypothetical protein
MTKSKVLPGFFLVAMFSFIGLVVGTMIGSLFVPKGSGLAGPAIALGYGFVGFAVAIIAGILLARKLAYPQLRMALLVSGIVSLFFCGWMVYRFFEEQRKRDSQSEAFGEHSSQISTMVPPPVTAEEVSNQAEVQSLGVGMVKPRLTPGAPLYFYSSADFSKLPSVMSVADSLTFFKSEHYIDIATAPPWFVPEVMKLDYDLLFLRAVTLSQNWLEVIVNQQTGETRWVDRHAVDFIHWPDFLLEVFAVEIADPESNPLRIKPLSHASIVPVSAGAVLHPIAIQGDWMKVVVGEIPDSNSPTGWIRWRDGDRLLITYSLLS